MNKTGKETVRVHMLETLLFFFPKMAFKHHTLLALREFVKPDEVKRIWNKTLEHQKTLASKRPQYSFGTNYLIHYMEWDCALYRSLQEEGVSESSAKELIEKINWSVFGSNIAVMFRVSQLRSRNLMARIEWMVDLMFLLVFSAPFQRRKIHSPNEVAFDILVCPLAKYFKDQGVAELTSAAACSLDHHMAGLWGVILSRSQTIAQGHPICDFRFHTNLPKKETGIQTPRSR
ncbi:MAG: L-2-amino-thiazoline-4-carboxylic acid hydrolase [Blastocatellia bacterium]|nr:L-2-amino-thiazoline-4-carboxylic acid hydrolase [Blastocatellia bacterium]